MFCGAFGDGVIIPDSTNDAYTACSAANQSTSGESKGSPLCSQSLYASFSTNSCRLSYGKSGMSSSGCCLSSGRNSLATDELGPTISLRGISFCFSQCSVPALFSAGKFPQVVDCWSVMSISHRAVGVRSLAIEQSMSRNDLKFRDFALSSVAGGSNLYKRFSIVSWSHRPEPCQAPARGAHFRAAAS